MAASLWCSLCWPNKEWMASSLCGTEGLSHLYLNLGRWCVNRLTPVVGVEFSWLVTYLFYAAAAVFHVSFLVVP